MLTNAQKQYLRGLAHHLDPIFQVGKAGVGTNMLQQLGSALEVRELFKVSVLKNCEESPADVGKVIASALDAEIVQVIGRVIVLYRESREHKKIVLPR